VLYMDGHVSFVKFPQAPGSTDWMLTSDSVNHGW